MNNNDDSGGRGCCGLSCTDLYIDNGDWEKEEWDLWPWCHCPGANDSTPFIFVLKVGESTVQLWIPLKQSNLTH